MDNPSATQSTGTGASLSPQQIDQYFSARTPPGTQLERSELLRQQARDLSHLMLQLTQQFMLWANSVIAINEAGESRRAAG
jgi:hypothetical protein